MKVSTPDHHLARLGIVPEQIIGYNREKLIQSGVAARVVAGRAERRLGIGALSNAL